MPEDKRVIVRSYCQYAKGETVSECASQQEQCYFVGKKAKFQEVEGLVQDGTAGLEQIPNATPVLFPLVRAPSPGSSASADLCTASLW